MANYYNENTIIFLDGKFVKAAESKIDLYSQSLHYGFAVFEGIRSKFKFKLFKFRQWRIPQMHTPYIGVPRDW